MVQMNSLPEVVLRAHMKKAALPLSIPNARQLGGIALKGGRRVKDGLLLRTTRLYDASAEDLRRLREDYSLSLILDMREEDEIRLAPDPAMPGVKWVQTPIIDFQYMKESMAARLQGRQMEPVDLEDFDMDRMLDMMILMTKANDAEGGLTGAYAGYVAGPLGREKLGLFFHELAANEHGAALWHCHTGKDRTGIAAGLILEVLGAEWETILADYETSNLYFTKELTEMEQRLRAKGVEEELLPPLCAFAGVYAPMMENAWKYMHNTWGGPIGYLTDGCGVSRAELELLRERYTEEA